MSSPITLASRLDAICAANGGAGDACCVMNEASASLRAMVTALCDIAAMGKKAGSELAKHRLTQLGIDWETGEPIRDYGRMT